MAKNKGCPKQKKMREVIMPSRKVIIHDHCNNKSETVMIWDGSWKKVKVC